MVASSAIIEATRRHLLSGQNEELNRLEGAFAAAATTLTVEFALNGIQPGATLAIDDEEVYVFSVDVGAKTALVQRGMNGSTDATHSDNALVFVKPKFSSFRILDAINNELRDLSSPMNGLFAVKTVDLTYVAAQSGYNLTSVGDIIDILEIRYKTAGPEDDWPLITEYALARDMNTTEFASGEALILYKGGFPGHSIRVRYKAPFVSITSATSDVAATSLLADSALDILSLGAAIRLVAPRDVKRSFTEHQGDTRRADEVPVGGGVISMRGLVGLRAQRIQSEAARLNALYPPLLRV